MPADRLVAIAKSKLDVMPRWRLGISVSVAATVAAVAAAALAVPPPPAPPRLHVDQACYRPNARVPVRATGFKPRADVTVFAAGTASTSTKAGADGRVATALVAPTGTPPRHPFAAELVTAQGQDATGAVREVSAAYLLARSSVCRTLRRVH